jgi:hypothetical protein
MNEDTAAPSGPGAGTRGSVRTAGRRFGLPPCQAVPVIQEILQLFRVLREYVRSGARRYHRVHIGAFL